MTGRVQNRYGFETQVMEFYPSNYVEYISGRWLVDTGEFKVKAKPSFPSALAGAQARRAPLRDHALGNPQEVRLQHGAHRQMAPRRATVSRSRRLEASTTSTASYGASSLYTPKENWSGVINHKHEAFSAQHQWKTGRKGEAAILRDGEEIIEDRYLTDAFRDEMLQYMEEKKDEPFFIYGAFSAPHVPFQAPVEYYCMYPHVEDENKRVYYAMISSLDDAIGAIHQKIKDLGIEEDTMIFFISDNGGRLVHARHRQRAPQGGEAHAVRGRHSNSVHDEVEGQGARGDAVQVPSFLNRYLRDFGGGGRRRPPERPRIRRCRSGSLRHRQEQGAAAPGALLAGRPHLGDSRWRLQAHPQHPRRLGRALQSHHRRVRR